MITEKELDEILDCVYVFKWGKCKKRTIQRRLDTKLDYAEKQFTKQKLRKKGLLEQSALEKARELVREGKFHVGYGYESSCESDRRWYDWGFRIFQFCEQAIKELEEKK